jgi:hypothetical protein
MLPCFETSRGISKNHLSLLIFLLTSPFGVLELGRIVETKVVEKVLFRDIWTV